ncbi:Abi family protein [Streptococcus phocae]|uniref:AbiD/F protein n=1 Tax=Streptococcus phocae TaxID=119224 RepID=A0A0P6S1B1_9STRE|nr:Abi family protein [Streptococcus phocae]KPJ22239.1 AbiD/F protein [Streptococcus phocae]
MDGMVQQEDSKVKYFLLEADQTKSMKSFSEFDDLKKKLSTPNTVTKAKVIINDSEMEFAKQFLFQTNYYSFSIYKKCLPNRDEKEFSFNDCVQLYNFNNFLRENLMKFTGKIELLIKSSIVHSLCSYYSGKLQKGECYLDTTIYVNSDECSNILKRIGRSLYSNQSKSLPIKHHIKKKNHKFPLWVIIPELTFGETTKFIEKLDKEYYNNWINELFLKNDYFNNPAMKDHIISSSMSWISATWYIRNVCAHYGRLYGCNFNVGVPTFYTPEYRKLKSKGKKKSHNKDLFAYMLAIKYLLICHSKLVQNEWNNFILEIQSKFDSDIIEKKKIGFPDNWEDFLTIEIK